MASLAWHIASHRITSWLRACVAGRLGGHIISSASVTASKIAALQKHGVYLATMQSLRMTMHRGFYGAASGDYSTTETPPL